MLRITLTKQLLTYFYPLRLWRVKNTTGGHPGNAVSVTGSEAFVYARAIDGWELTYSLGAETKQYNRITRQIDMGQELLDRRPLC
jgi:hypothetical protein